MSSIIKTGRAIAPNSATFLALWLAGRIALRLPLGSRTGFHFGANYLYGRIEEGRPTRMKKRAMAWEKCSRKGD